MNSETQAQEGLPLPRLVRIGGALLMLAVMCIVSTPFRIVEGVAHVLKFCALWLGRIAKMFRLLAEVQEFWWPADTDGLSIDPTPWAVWRQIRIKGFKGLFNNPNTQAHL